MDVSPHSVRRALKTAGRSSFFRLSSLLLALSLPLALVPAPRVLHYADRTIYPVLSVSPDSNATLISLLSHFLY